MRKTFTTLFVLAVITGVLSFIATLCDVRSGANRGYVMSGDATYYYDDFGEEYVGFKVMPEDGTTKYFDEDTHIMAKGETEISGNMYLFSNEGVMLTGFQTTGGKTRYYSPGTGVMKKGWLNDNSETYYFDETTGEMVTGWTEIDGNKYYFDPSDGKSAKGMFKLDNGTYYADPENCRVASGLKVIEGKQYFFDEETGLMKTGWIDYNDERYFFNEETGEGLDGIVEKEDGKYGFIGGLMIRNKRAMADNHLYYFGDDGKVVREVDGSKPMVALTYDDGPSQYTNSIIDTLEKYGGKATFFIVGDRISWNEDPAKREGELNYELGNHTYSHNTLTKLKKEQIQEKIQKTDDELIRVTGRKSTCLRPPGGSCNKTVRESVELPIILWSIDSRDWESRNADKICARVIGKVKDGDIVLMHDLYQATADATKRIVPALVNAGFQLVTVEEMGLLKRGGLEPGVVYYSIEKK